MRRTSLDYASAYETPQTVFGAECSPEFLVSRVRSFSWAASFRILADLAAKAAFHGVGSEFIRQLTIDQLMKLTGNSRLDRMLRTARDQVRIRRPSMVIAHEQAVSFLQHLVLLEGGEHAEIPTHAEVALWLVCAGQFVADWSEPAAEADRRTTLIAAMSHAARFNNRPDPLRAFVRSARLFEARPPRGELSDEVAWNGLCAEAFGGTYSEFFETALGPLYLISRLWGGDGEIAQPVITLPKFISETRLDPARFRKAIDLLSATRESLRDEIQRRVRNGLPHAPTALLYRPFVEIEPNTFVGASPWALQHQLRFAGWAHLLGAARNLSAKSPAEVWLRAFGDLVELWCRRVAREAEKSKFLKGTIQMPPSPGTNDEVEDVVLIEGGAVVLFSVKARAMKSEAAREAISPAVTMDWYEKYFFSDAAGTRRGGVARLLNGATERIRLGNFEHLGVSRSARILPVLVSYDSLGESDLLYRWIEERCKALGLLVDTGPLTIATVDDFEQLMARAADGRSVVELLRRREKTDRHRRLDQILAEHPLHGRRKRLPFFVSEQEVLNDNVKARLFGAVSDKSTSPVRTLNADSGRHWR